MGAAPQKNSRGAQGTRAVTQPELVTARAREAIQRAGGLIGRGDDRARPTPARVPAARVAGHATATDSPSPVARLGDQDVWLRDAVRLWCQRTERDWDDASGPRRSR